GEAARLRARLEAALTASGGEIVAGQAPRLPAIGAVRMPGVASAVQLIRFDGMGLAVSAGSACSSGSLKPSHVLTAMGVEGVGEVIRVSLGRETTTVDVDRFITAWQAVAGRT
ncbi:MAG TPA: aminotransferase class V-fold PLP-dependent enzyme, partial [Novosphingobium sp.]|nr:aminotransferase class V-fold PLP-dependent enzyme [Novosphingobium sp.]